MNTYALITFILLFNYTVGILTDFGTSDEQAIYNAISRTTDTETNNINNVDALQDTFSSANDQNSDKRTGNENRFTFNLVNAISGIGTFVTLRTSTPIEAWIMMILKIFYTGVNSFILLVIFDKIKNRKYD